MSARQQRQLAYISELTSDIRHTPGAANVVADSLSHPPLSGISPPSPLLAPGVMVSEVSEVWEVTDNPVKISSLPSPFPASTGGINFSELAAEQLSCPNVLRLQNFKTLKLVTVMVQGKPLICDSKTKVRLALYITSRYTGH